MYFWCHLSYSWVFNFWLGQDLISLMYLVSVCGPHMSYQVLLSSLGHISHTSLQNARASLVIQMTSTFSKMFKPTFRRALLNAPVAFKSLHLAWALGGLSGSNGAPHLIKDFFLTISIFGSSLTLCPLIQWVFPHFYILLFYALLAMFTQRLQLQLSSCDLCSKVNQWFR